MKESTERQHVYVGLSQHKLLAKKKADVYVETSRKVSIQRILEWLVDNHLDDYPME